MLTLPKSAAATIFRKKHAHAMHCRRVAKSGSGSGSGFGRIDDAEYWLNQAKRQCVNFQRWKIVCREQEKS